MKSKYLGLIGATLIAGPMAAHADLQWNYSYAGPAGSGVLGSGVITTADLSGGTYAITGMSGLACEADGCGGGAFTLLPPPRDPADCSGGCIELDNLLVPGSPTLSLDSGGIGFDDIWDHINIYQIGGQYYDLTVTNWLAQCVVGCTGGSVAGSTPINFEISAVPEPASLAVFGLGLAGLGVARRRKSAP